MAKPKSVGAQVRSAMDGPTLDHDALIGQITDREREAYARRSDAAESGAMVKEFLEETDLNSKAYSVLAAIVKLVEKKDGVAKAMDVIRSLETGLPLIKNHIGGQGSAEMDLGEPEPKKPAAKVTKADVSHMTSEDPYDLPNEDGPDDLDDDAGDFEDAAAALDEPKKTGKVIKAFAG